MDNKESERMMKKKKSINNQNNQNHLDSLEQTKTIKEVILLSLMEYNKGLVHCNQEEIELFLSQIESGKHISVIPIVSNRSNKDLIEVYSMRENKKLVKHRMLRSRTSVQK
jgi:Tat protein secretion system quality control protein TatD with DNase activity